MLWYTLVNIVTVLEWKLMNEKMNINPLVVRISVICKQLEEENTELHFHLTYSKCCCQDPTEIASLLFFFISPTLQSPGIPSALSGVGVPQSEVCVHDLGPSCYSL